MAPVDFVLRKARGIGAVARYAAASHAFETWATNNGFAVDSAPALDLALAEYLADEALDGKLASAGSYTVAGIEWKWPELGRRGPYGLP